MIKTKKKYYPNGRLLIMINHYFTDNDFLDQHTLIGAGSFISQKKLHDRGKKEGILDGFPGDVS